LFERCTRFSSRAHQVRLELGRALHQGTQSEPKEHLHGVVAWFLTQLTTQVFPFFEIPDSAVRFVVIALAAGFPIAMLLSWLYEFTPEGIIRTEDPRFQKLCEKKPH
jgi:hypothetical protein